MQDPFIHGLTSNSTVWFTVWYDQSKMARYSMPWRRTIPSIWIFISENPSTSGWKNMHTQLHTNTRVGAERNLEKEQRSKFYTEAFIIHHSRLAHLSIGTMISTSIYSPFPCFSNLVPKMDLRSENLYRNSHCMFSKLRVLRGVKCRVDAYDKAATLILKSQLFHIICSHWGRERRGGGRFKSNCRTVDDNPENNVLLT